MKNLALTTLLFSTAFACIESDGKENNLVMTNEIKSMIDSSGNTIQTRFHVPSGFERVKSKENSFPAYLQNLSLKDITSPVKYHDGSQKPNHNVYCSVVNLPIGRKNLHQCADAVIRLRADYLYNQKRYNQITFKLTNGFEVPYSKWIDGFRVRVSGNKTSWVRSHTPQNDDRTFAKYKEFIYTYAGTLSLAKELTAKPIGQMEIGDVFVQGGSPGHAIIVVDMAINPGTQEKCFMLAQSYMPAQEIQILVNQKDSKNSPWYPLEFVERLQTPEWTFLSTDLKRF